MSQQRSILITGCSSGIGYVSARILQARGWRVFATARRHDDVSRLLGEGLESIQLDLDDSGSIRNAVIEIQNRTNGILDGVFHNGGYQQPGAVEDLSRDVLRANFETNLFGAHELTTRVIPLMRKQGHGRIIFNSSILGFIALPYRGAYNATKHAMEGLADTLRLELKKNSNIHVAIIEPGPIGTSFRATSYKMFMQNIDRENSAYRELYKGLESRLTKPGPVAPFTLPPEAVTDKLIHALESKNPKPRYYVTKPTYFFGLMRRILSTRGLDKLLQSVSRGENK